MNALVDRLSRLTAPLKRPRVKRWLKAVGFLLLTAGVIWSITALDLDWRDLSPGLLALNALILAPINVLIGAWSFQVTAAAVGRRVGVAPALQTSAAADLAELLPIPGGAMVRGAALVAAGAKLREATSIVLLTALLTLGMTVALSSAALARLTDPAWALLALGALLGCGVILWTIARTAGATHLLALIAIRVLLLALTLVRVVVGFATFAVTITWTEAALYAAAPTLGAAVGLVPAGLGLNEAIAAGLAVLIAASPAVAFLAIALNRCLGLAAGAALILALALIQRGKKNG